ncbi:hypothetical protein FNJ47_25360 [Bradyrhizobium sp. UFLA 03-164]|uniref:Uncharacterized protein n=1 Tax=Bradyrhizobium uaiense TaxID=2594946 RepID=A0A6P1BKV9_9BRAD|nr:hypothetical protein [Bradyrhizobium uaiense]
MALAQPNPCELRLRDERCRWPMDPVREFPNDARTGAAFTLKRDEIGLNHHRALAPCLSMIFSENRFTLFRIML